MNGDEVKRMFSLAGQKSCYLVRLRSHCSFFGKPYLQSLIIFKTHHFKKGESFFLSYAKSDDFEKHKKYLVEHLWYTKK